MAEEDVQALRRIYDALSRWDVDELADDVAHDFEWLIPETLPWGGAHHGTDGVRALADVFEQHVEGLWADPDDFIDAGEEITVIGRFRGSGKRTGEEFETEFAHVWTIRDGVAARCRVYIDTARILAAIGEPEP